MFQLHPLLRKLNIYSNWQLNNMIHKVTPISLWNVQGHLRQSSDKNNRSTSGKLMMGPWETKPCAWDKSCNKLCDLNGCATGCNKCVKPGRCLCITVIVEMYSNVRKDFVEYSEGVDIFYVGTKRHTSKSEKWLRKLV